MPKYNLQKSRKEIGIIHPAIKSKLTGIIVAGKDRLKSDPTWTITEREFKSREEELLYQIADNTRRTITKDERAKEFKELYNIYKEQGIQDYNIASKIVNKTGFTEQYVRKLVKNETEFRKSTNSLELLPTNIKEHFSFLDPKEIGLLQKLYSKHKKIIDLLYHVKKHGESVKVPSVNQILSTASINELLEVAYTKLENTDFNVNEDAQRFWKFLAEEYSKRSEVKTNA
jgi:predicted transcriptional regulator